MLAPLSTRAWPTGAAGDPGSPVLALGSYRVRVWVCGVGVESALGPALRLAIEVGHSTGARGLLPLGQGMELRLASPGTCTPLSGCQHLPPMHRCDVWGILTPDRGSWRAIVGSI